MYIQYILYTTCSYGENGKARYINSERRLNLYTARVVRYGVKMSRAPYFGPIPASNATLCSSCIYIATQWSAGPPLL